MKKLIKKLIKAKVRGSILLATMLVLLTLLVLVHFYQLGFSQSVENNHLLIEYFDKQ